MFVLLPIVYIISYCGKPRTGLRDQNNSYPQTLRMCMCRAAERLPKWGGGTKKKGHFLEKKGTYKGKSQSENIQFWGH